MAADGRRPPLHKDAITAATERADTYKPDTDTITRFPVYALEPFQYQRAAALEKAAEILPDHTTEDIIQAAAFIECGKLPPSA